MTARAERVATETAKLSEALTASPRVGSWGEVSLRRVLEIADMSAICDFGEQPVVDGSRPDVVIRMPETGASTSTPRPRRSRRMGRKPVGTTRRAFGRRRRRWARRNTARRMGRRWS